MRRHVAVCAALLVTVVGGGAGLPARAQVPPDELEVMLVIDTSASMRPALDAAKAAANEFVLAMPDDVRIGLETFGDTVTLLSAPTLDRAALTTLITSITADGDTALYDAVVEASQHFTPAASARVLVVLSDGRDEGSTATLADAVAAAAGTYVEAISLTTELTDLESLRALGAVTSADDAAGVSAAFARIAGLIAANVVPTSVVPSSPPSTPPPPTVTDASVVPPIAEARPVATGPSASVAVPEVAPGSPSSSVLWFGGAAVFLGLLGLGLSVFPNARVSRERLGITKPRSVSEVGVRTVSAVEAVLERHGRRDQLATSLAIADVSVKPAEFVVIVAVVALVAGFVGLASSGVLVGVLCGVAVVAVATWYVRRGKRRRRTAFADQLPDVVQLVTTALRSGYGITQALESVAEEAEEPARSEFAKVLVEVRLGRDLSESMRSLAQRMASKDLEWMVAAIDISRDTGGNLSEILNTVSTTIRERGRLARHIRTLTAEGQASARILTVFPFVMALWQWWANPENFELLTHGPGLVAVVIAATLMVTGTVWVRHIVNSVEL